MWLVSQKHGWSNLYDCSLTQSLKNNHTCKLYLTHCMTVDSLCCSGCDFTSTEFDVIFTRPSGDKLDCPGWINYESSIWWDNFTTPANTIKTLWLLVICTCDVATSWLNYSNWKLKVTKQHHKVTSINTGKMHNVNEFSQTFKTNSRHIHHLYVVYVTSNYNWRSSVDYHCVCNVKIEPVSF